MTRNSLPAIAATALIALSTFSVVLPTTVQAMTTAPRPPSSSTVPGGPDVPEPTSSSYSCADELGHLRRVHVEELAAVQDPGKVWVSPICVGDSMFRADGNAGALRTAIAGNGAMAAALDGAAFGPEDVVGVRKTALDKVILYVTPSRR